MLSHRWGDSDTVAIMAPVSDVAQAVACAAGGARIVDVGAVGALIPAIRRATEGLLVGGRAEGADLVMDAYLAARAGVGLICADPAAAAEAARRGIAPERILVRVTPAQIESVAESGWATLVDVDADAGGVAGVAGVAAVEAVAAVCGWLGVSVIRTRHVAQVRRALDMTETIRGTRPPAWTVRGLA